MPTDVILHRPLRRHGSIWPSDDHATSRGRGRHVSPRFPHICFLLDLLKLLLLPLLLSRSAHGHAVRLKILFSLRTARVPTIILPSWGFSCYCTPQVPQEYHPPCVQLVRLHHRRVPTMVVQQPSLQHQRWVAIDPHRARLVLRARWWSSYQRVHREHGPVAISSPMKLQRSLLSY